MYGNQGRQVGVKTPEHQYSNISDKPSLTVTGVLALQFFAVRYVDSNGKEIAMLVVKDHMGEYYQAPAGDSWIAQMRPLSDRMKQNVESVMSTALGSPGAEVPTEDQVDVVASMVAEEISDAPTAG